MESDEPIGDTYAVTSSRGVRHWTADDALHAEEQHRDAFADERVHDVQFVKRGPHFEVA